MTLLKKLTELIPLKNIPLAEHCVMLHYVKRISHSDRRQEIRFPQSIEATVRELPLIGFAENTESGAAPARIQNISRGGMCIVTSFSVDKSSVLRCEIAIDDLPTRIPTLMQVRWTQKQSEPPDTFISGLETLL